MRGTAHDSRWLMAWFQREATDPRTSAVIHQGTGEIVVRRLFRGQLTLPVQAQVWELAPGTPEGDHTHASDDPADNWEELYYVLSGTGAVTIDGERNAIAPGDAVLVPADVDHGLDATGDEPLTILLMFGKPPAG
jgi:quercetin dioxygenase-like cupin family protein